MVDTHADDMGVDVHLDGELQLDDEAVGIGHSVTVEGCDFDHADRGLREAGKQADVLLLHQSFQVLARPENDFLRMDGAWFVRPSVHDCVFHELVAVPEAA